MNEWVVEENHLRFELDERDHQIMGFAQRKLLEYLEEHDGLHHHIRGRLCDSSCPVCAVQNYYKLIGRRPL